MTGRGRGALLEKAKQHIAEQERLKKAALAEQQCGVSRGRATMMTKLVVASADKDLAIPGVEHTKLAAAMQSASKLSADELEKEKQIEKQFTSAIGKMTIDDKGQPSSTSDEAKQDIEDTSRYQGTSGQRLKTAVNYIRLQLEPNHGVYEYEVRFNPEVDARSNRSKLLTQALAETSTNTVKVFDGGSVLYLPEQRFVGTKQFQLPLPSNATDIIELTLTFKKIKSFSDPNVLHLYNCLFKRIMNVLLYQRMGRNYFNFESHRKVLIPQHRLEVIPGFAYAVEEREGGLMLCLDTQHRVIRNQTVYDLLSELRNSMGSGGGGGGAKNFKELAAHHLIGAVVLTKYNNKNYRVDDISWDMTPQSTFEQRKTGTQITFSSYYQEQYGIRVQDVDQPMLVSKHTVMVEKVKVDNLILLVPELCHLTGLTDTMRSDFKVMKDVAVHTRVTPNQRMLALRTYLESVNRSQECQNILQAWGLRLAGGTTDIVARTLDAETVWFGDNAQSKGVDWNNHVVRHKVTGPMDITNWKVFHTPKDKKFADEFVHLTLRTAASSGCVIARPQIVVLRDDKTETYAAACRTNFTPNTDVYVFICPTLRSDRYSVIKNMCSVELGCASQVVLSKTLANPKKVQTIISKIALQINCKLGGTLWNIKFPVSGWMVCGVDAYHGGKLNSVCGFVASISSGFTRWFSEAVFQSGEIGNHYKIPFRKALELYCTVNGSFPSRVIIYRDGVSEGQLAHVRNFELPQFENVLVELNIKATVTFIVVQKRINTRIFHMVGGNNNENPPAGTIIDTVITRGENQKYYDFYLVPQTVRQGTVNPTRYIVLHDTAEMKADHVQRCTFKLCHLYYNWSGTIRVPAPCMYAHKLAAIVGQYLKKSPSSKLADKLHFL